MPRLYCYLAPDDLRKVIDFVYENDGFFVERRFENGDWHRYLVDISSDGSLPISCSIYSRKYANEPPLQPVKTLDRLKQTFGLRTETPKHDFSNFFKSGDVRGIQLQRGISSSDRYLAYYMIDGSEFDASSDFFKAICSEIKSWSTRTKGSGYWVGQHVEAYCLAHQIECDDVPSTYSEGTKKALANASQETKLDWFRTSVVYDDYSERSLLNSYIVKARVTDVSFRDADLSNSEFDESDFINVDFSGANLSNTLLGGLYEGCNFEGASMKGAKLHILQKGDFALSEKQIAEIIWDESDEE